MLIEFVVLFQRNLNVLIVCSIRFCVHRHQLRVGFLKIIFFVLLLLPNAGKVVTIFRFLLNSSCTLCTMSIWSFTKSELTDKDNNSVEELP